MVALKKRQLAHETFFFLGKSDGPLLFPGIRWMVISVTERLFFPTFREAGIIPPLYTCDFLDEIGGARITFSGVPFWRMRRLPLFREAIPKTSQNKRLAVSPSFFVLIR